MTRAEYLEAFQRTGWLDDRPLTERLDRLGRAYDQDPVRAYLALADLRLAPGSIHDADSYARVVDELARASRGRFAPSDVSASLDAAARTATVSFHHGARMRSVTVPCGLVATGGVTAGGVAPDGRVLDLVNQAMAEDGAPLRFCPLPGAGRTLALALVRPAAFAAAQAAGVLPGEDDDPDDDEEDGGDPGEEDEDDDG